MQTAELWSVKDLAEHYDVSEETVYGWVRRRVVPHQRAGRLLRFEPEKIRAHFAREALAAHVREIVDEAPALTDRQKRQLAAIVPDEDTPA